MRWILTGIMAIATIGTADRLLFVDGPSRTAALESPAVVVVDPDSSVAVAEGPVDTVRIRQFAFEPDTLKVAPGTTVLWIQHDPLVHNVHIGAGGDRTPLRSDRVGAFLAPRTRFAVTFRSEGRYRYWCDPHPYMAGTIVVRAVDGRGPHPRSDAEASAASQ